GPESLRDWKSESVQRLFLQLPQPDMARDYPDLHTSEAAIDFLVELNKEIGTSYGDARSQLATGDLMFATGNYADSLRYYLQGMSQLSNYFANVESLEHLWNDGWFLNRILDCYAKLGGM
ncbi:hypothetical protein HDV05_006242, partial [Chytridiales sp. JEL 0842]